MDQLNLKNNEVTVKNMVDESDLEIDLYENELISPWKNLKKNTQLSQDEKSLKESDQIRKNIAKLSNQILRRPGAQEALITLKERIREDVKGTMQTLSDTGRNAENERRNTSRQIPRSLEEKGGSGMQEIEPINSKRSSNAVTVIDPHTDSMEQSSALRKEASASMSLIDSTAKHLHDLMISTTGPVKDENSNPFRLPEVHRVESAAKIAQQLYQVMKLKLEAIKVMKDVQ